MSPTMTHTPSPRRPVRRLSAFQKQRGAAALFVSVVLLVCMTLVAFFANRSLLFEQKTSANQLRSTRAFEAAEAGIEWATAMLNDPRNIDANCTPGATGATKSFRATYLPYDAATGFSPVSNAQPGCSISDSSGTPAISCRCPAAGTNPAGLASSTTPTFTLKFDPVNTTTLPDATPDTESVLVTSYGCTSADGRCVPGASGTADAYQKISVILKLRPSLKSVPAAPITTGGALQLTSSASVVNNTDLNSNGILVDAGTGINSVSVPGCTGSFKDFQSATTLPGTPWQNSMITNDASLSSLSSDANAMFQTFFGTTLAQFQADPSTKNLTSCGSVATDYTAAFSQGYRSFYTTCDFATTSDLGSSTDPIIFVTTGALTFHGGANIYGLVYGDQATWDALGLGNGTLNGSLIVRGSYCANANATYNYSASALKTVRGTTGSMDRVPGSWKDF